MANSNPFLIDFWDVFIMVLAVIVRFMVALNYKSKQKRGEFDLKKYFDTRHVIRWSGHLVTSTAFLLFTPELFIEYIGPKYFPDFQDWNFTLSFAIGFAGYDLIKLAESITSPIISKFTGIK